MPHFRRAWGYAQSFAFAVVKTILTTAPVLNFPDFESEFVVHVDGNIVGVGAFLAQASKTDLDKTAYMYSKF